MLDGEMMVPRIQFTDAGNKLVPIEGISQVLAQFQIAKSLGIKVGALDGLNYLLTTDPNLGSNPVEFLKRREPNIDYLIEVLQDRLGLGGR